MIFFWFYSIIYLKYCTDYSLNLNLLIIKNKLGDELCGNFVGFWDYYGNLF